jgi:hypothetical protein
MSERAPEVGVLAPLLLLAVFAANSDKIASRFSRYWELNIAPTVNAIGWFFLWVMVIGVGGFLVWVTSQAIYRYCKEHRIVVRSDYAGLQSELSELKKSYEQAQASIGSQHHEIWALKNKLWDLEDKFEKVTAKPESVIDDIVKDVVGEAHD